MGTARKRARAREIPWGDLRHVPEGEGRRPWETWKPREPWELAAAAEEAAIRLGGAAAAGARPHPPCPVLIGFTPTWGPAITQYEPGKGGPCPGCGSITVGKECTTPLRPGEVCVVCGASRAAAVQWPMQPPLRRRVRGRKLALRGGL